MLHARKDYNRRVQDNENLIPDDEPVVLFRAQDLLACQAVEYYARLCAANQAPEVAEKMIAHAKKMRDWPVKKVPDVPKGE